MTRRNPFLSTPRSITVLLALWAGIALAVVAETVVSLWRDE